MTQKICKTYVCELSIAGDIEVAKQFCRDYFYNIKKWCCTISETTFIYTGGEEKGMKIGFINYPRFIRDEEDIKEDVEVFSLALSKQLCQKSYSIITPEETIYVELMKKDS